MSGLCVARNDVRRVRFAPFKRRRFDIQPKRGFLLLFAMTFITAPFKNRPDIARKINRLRAASACQHQRDGEQHDAGLSRQLDFRMGTRCSRSHASAVSRLRFWVTAVGTIIDNALYKVVHP